MTSIEFIESKIKHFKKMLETSKSPINKPIDKAMLEIFKNRIEEYENVLKELKALKIIKKKKVDIWKFIDNGIFNYSYDDYYFCWNYYSCEKLTKEEFDLLKRWLDE